MNINKFVENLNKLSKVKVHEIGTLKNSIYTKKEEIKNKKSEILDELEEMGFNFAKYEEKEVIKALNLQNINRNTLEERITTTGKHIYTLINELKTLNTALQGYENFEKNIDQDGYIHPKFSVNVKGLVSVAEPGLARLEKSFITSMLGYSTSIEFLTFDDLYSFIKTYRPSLGIREDNQNSFIVVGMRLFFDFKRVEEWDITKDYEEKIEEFYNNLYGLDGLDALREIRANRARAKFVTGKTYAIFDKIYSELYPIFQNTKTAIKNGLLTEPWFGSLPKNSIRNKVDGLGYMPFGASTNEELETEHLEGLKIRMDEFNNLYNQYIELKAKVDKGEDITGITKEKEILNQIRESFKRRVSSESELDEIIKKYETKAEVKAEPKQEQLTLTLSEPAKLKIYDLEKNREIMNGYGWSDEVIEKNIEEIKATEDRLNANFNSPSFVICAEQGSDTVFDFLLSGKQQIKGVRMLFDSKMEEGDTTYDLYVRVKGVRHIVKVTAPKGTAHRTLIATLPDGTTQTYTASNKKNNIRQIVVGVFNTLC